MEDLKRLFRKGSFLLILLCLAVAAGNFFTGFKEDKGRKQPEESWEPAMGISGSAATGNTGAGDNGKSRTACSVKLKKKNWKTVPCRLPWRCRRYTGMQQ